MYQVPGEVKYRLDTDGCGQGPNVGETTVLSLSELHH